jgi:ATP-dependent Lon protease
MRLIRLHAGSGRAQPRARDQKLARKAVKEPDDQEEEGEDHAGEELLEEYLGVPKYRYGEIDDEPQVGVVTGLAWTEVGGETADHRRRHDPRQGPHDGDRQPQGRDEGVDLGGERLCPLAGDRFGIEPPLFDKRDIHVHVPEGATPKDGPSAGIAMATAIVSVMTGIPVRTTWR